MGVAALSSALVYLVAAPAAPVVVVVVAVVVVDVVAVVAESPLLLLHRRPSCRAVGQVAWREACHHHQPKLVFSL